jgi:UDP-glucuronate decarboxylase
VFLRDERIKGDPQKPPADISRARRLLLGWEPTIDLVEGLTRTIAYFRGLL